MTQSIDNTAYSRELLQVLHKQVGVDAVSVLAGQREWNTILVEVVANRNLSAESITATVKIDLVVIVIACLNEYRNVQLSTCNGIDNTNLESEVRQ